MLHPTTVKQLLSNAEHALRQLANPAVRDAASLQRECRRHLAPLFEVEGSVSDVAERAYVGCENAEWCLTGAAELYDLNCLIQP